MKGSPFKLKESLTYKKYRLHLNNLPRVLKARCLVFLQMCSSNIVRDRPMMHVYVCMWFHTSEISFPLPHIAPKCVFKVIKATRNATRSFAGPFQVVRAIIPQVVPNTLVIERRHALHCHRSCSR